MTTSTCPFPDFQIHDHGNPQCHEASRNAGAVNALREAADVIEAVDPVEWALVGQDAGIAASTILRTRADQIARGEQVTS